MASITQAPMAVQEASDKAAAYLKENFWYVQMYRNWVPSKGTMRIKLYCVSGWRTGQKRGLANVYQPNIFKELTALGFTIKAERGRISATLYHTADAVLPPAPPTVGRPLPKAPRMHCAHCGHAL